MTIDSSFKSLKDKPAVIVHVEQHLTHENNRLLNKDIKPDSLYIDHLVSSVSSIHGRSYDSRKSDASSLLLSSNGRLGKGDCSDDEGLSIMSSEEFSDTPSSYDIYATYTESVIMTVDPKDLEVEEFPDGGWGWVVVFAAFMVLFLMTGLMRSYGVLMMSVLEEFPAATTQESAWVPGLLSTVSFTLSPVGSVLSQRFGCTPVVVAGGFISGGAVMMCYFANNIYYLIIFFGILGGFGNALGITPSLLIVSQYFKKRRATANSLTMCGSALGGLCLPLIIEACLNSLNLRQTYILLGASLLLVCICALTYRQPWLKQNQERAKAVQACNHPSKETIVQKIVRLFSLHLLWDPYFVLVTLCVVGMSTSSPHLLFFLPQHVKELKFSKNHAATVLSAASGGELVGRSAFGWFTDKKFISRKYEMLIRIVTAASGVLMVASSADYYVIMAGAVLQGLGNGAWQCFVPVLLAEQFGTYGLSGALSLTRMTQGMTNLAVPPIAGGFHDIHGHYSGVFYFMGGCMVLASFVPFALPIIQRMREKKQQKHSYEMLR